MTTQIETSYNGYTPGRCASCAGTGVFQKGQGGPCYRCSGTGTVSTTDSKRNWGYDVRGAMSGTVSTETPETVPVRVGWVTVFGHTLNAYKTSGMLRIEGKLGCVYVCDDGDVEFTDSIPWQKRTKEVITEVRRAAKEWRPALCIAA